MNQCKPIWSEQHPLEIWVKEDFILPGFRPVPLLLHMTPPDTDPELLFWNLLREKLNQFIHIHRFKNLQEAGSLIVTPNTYKDYILSTDKWSSVYHFNRKALISGKTVITFTGGSEYNPQPQEIVFSVSTYQCKTEKSVATPNWLYDIGTKVSPIAKPSMPTVGFVGNTEYPSKLNSIARYLPIPDATFPDLGNLQWEDFSILVPYSQVHRIGEIIGEFHDKRSEEELRSSCRKSREAFEYLLPHNFILKSLHNILSYQKR
ncbi:hypothetical protein [Coleofasciculus sp.]|uniref:hypothetical protein n=1 Tax=Coleofasciculus sp. TaxID=3100458 RepID=UPI0039FA81D6